MAPNLSQIIETFALLDEWEDRYKYLLELGDFLEPLPLALHCSEYKVSGCTSQVWLYPYCENNKLIFQADSDAHTVKGLLYIALSFYNGKTAKEIIEEDFQQIMALLDLKDHISVQRSNGLQSVVNQIKLYAKQHNPS